jgi:hypothetical protein
VKFINQRNNDGPDSEEFSLDESIEFQLEGTIKNFDLDRDDNAWTFVLTQTPNEEKESGFNYILNILHMRQNYVFTDDKYPWLSGIHINIIIIYL